MASVSISPSIRLMSLGYDLEARLSSRWEKLVFIATAVARSLLLRNWRSKLSPTSQECHCKMVQVRLQEMRYASRHTGRWDFPSQRPRESRIKLRRGAPVDRWEPQFPAAPAFLHDHAALQAAARGCFLFPSWKQNTDESAPPARTQNPNFRPPRHSDDETTGHGGDEPHLSS
ncbi:hypothetical protein NDU88_002693 [Pleurodeles waltl]|uniref:Uncharacterized protein n=1 Tax=Pleurodeles waltl TaxID=8319 RepID=A0AAV7VE09_PLEWA|nr:hypothetical protein NDU88_002693 [Pleurodeles waltl]